MGERLLGCRTLAPGYQRQELVERCVPSPAWIARLPPIEGRVQPYRQPCDQIVNLSGAIRSAKVSSTASSARWAPSGSSFA
jgi:hypothetical protein